MKQRKKYLRDLAVEIKRKEQIKKKNREGYQILELIGMQVCYQSFNKQKAIRTFNRYNKKGAGVFQLLKVKVLLPKKNTHGTTR